DITIATDLDPGATIPALIARGSPIILLYRPGHWEAILPQEPVPRLDALEPVPLEEPPHRRFCCNPCNVA
ncbi:MAG: hypothetical protein LBB19_04700, partial [Puniceicoccales bacterium]|nr:hypothetical protein [Puniceicoccales bacterium]